MISEFRQKIITALDTYQDDRKLTEARKKDISFIRMIVNQEKYDVEVYFKVQEYLKRIKTGALGRSALRKKVKMILNNYGLKEDVRSLCARLATAEIEPRLSQQTLEQTPVGESSQQRLIQELNDRLERSIVAQNELIKVNREQREAFEKRLQSQQTELNKTNDRYAELVELVEKLIKQNDMLREQIKQSNTSLPHSESLQAVHGSSKNGLFATKMSHSEQSFLINASTHRDRTDYTDMDDSLLDSDEDFLEEKEQGSDRSGVSLVGSSQQ